MQSRKRSTIGHAEPSNVKRPQYASQGQPSEEKVFSSHKVPRLTKRDYTIGWICVLADELAASQAVLDAEHADLPQNENDTNVYTLGRVAQHNVVIACLGSGTSGVGGAAATATNILRSFPAVRFCLLVGIGGGAPQEPSRDSQRDLRLGDVVVSHPGPSHGGVLQYDFGKTIQEGRFIRTGHSNKPPTILMSAVSKLRAFHRRKGSSIQAHLSAMLRANPGLQSDFRHQGSEHDLLFEAEYDHSDARGQEECQHCDKQKLVSRVARPSHDPVIHYGLIGSANQVMRHGRTRERLRKEAGILCFEMEAAGLVDNFPCLVIRGICDYSDSHKNKRWQPYAAATAAAYAKELLYLLPADQVEYTPIAASMLEPLQEQLNAIVEKLEPLSNDLQLRQRKDLLDWVSPSTFESEHHDILRKQQPGTGQWFLNSEEFKDWLHGRERNLFCPGIPGAGKSVLVATLIDYLRLSYSPQEVPVIFIYCSYDRRHEQTAESLLAILLRQFLEQTNLIPDDIQTLYASYSTKKKKMATDEICTALLLAVSSWPRVSLVIDALDECSDNVRRVLLQRLSNIQKQSRLCILVTARTMDALEGNFSFGTQLEIRAQKSDVESYLASNIGTLSRCVRRNLSLQEEIIKKISNAVDGMFLLATLHLKRLESKRTVGDIEDTLRNLQEGSGALEMLYNDAITRIESQPEDDRNWARRIITWVVRARRPLTTAELQHALAVKSGDRQIQEKYLPDIQELLPLCAGLVVLNPKSDAIQLVHFTTQEYFEDDRHTPDWIKSAQMEITQVCLTYLSFDNFACGTALSPKALTDRVQQNAFLHYAAKYWGTHASSVQEKTAALAIPFLENISLTHCASQAMIAEMPHAGSVPPDMSGLHFVALFGLNHLLHQLLSSSKESRLREVDALDKELYTPLARAASQGHVTTVDFLLEEKADVNPKPGLFGNALWLACRAGHTTVVEKLLERGADPAVGNKPFGDPLKAAAEGGNRTLVEMLLKISRDSGKQFNCMDAMEAATKGGHSEVVMALLEAGSSFTSPRTLHLGLGSAVSRGHLDVVGQLLNAGAEAAAIPIQSFRQAIRNSYTKILDALLVTLNITSMGELWLRSIVEACESNDSTVPRWLMKAGVSGNVNNKTVGNALCNASYRGSNKAVEFLVDIGVDVNLRGKPPFSHAIIAASFRGHGMVIKQLLKGYTELQAEQQKEIYIAAMKAAKNNGFDEVEEILQARLAQFPSPVGQPNPST